MPSGGKPESGWVDFQRAAVDLVALHRLEQGTEVTFAEALSEKIGLTLTAYLNVRLEKHSDSHKRNPMDVFRASVQKWPEVVECHALTGDMDYLLRVVVRNMAHYSRFVLDTLLKHPSVQDCKTSFVLDRVKSTTALPYEHSADWCSGDANSA
jgi:Lrp/AsnC family leucine-responsive transcriptional regulator